MIRLFEYRVYRTTEEPVPFCWKVLFVLFMLGTLLAMAAVCGSCQPEEEDIGNTGVGEGLPATIRLEVAHKQESRFSGSLVMIRPAAPGTGVIAGGAMRAVLESVGVKNVLAKSKGSSNPHNLVKATIKALCELRDAHSVARLRGISMDKVFNG